MKTWSSWEVTIQIHKQDHCGKYKIRKHQQVRWCAFNKNKAKVYLLFRYWWGQDSATHWILPFNKIWNGSTRTRTSGVPTTCFYSQPPKNSFKKCCATSRRVLKKWVSGSTQKRRKFQATKAALARTQNRKWKSMNTDKRRKREILGPDDYVQATRDDRNQESYQGSLGDVSQVRAGADIEKIHAQTSSPAVRRTNNSDDMLRIWNMGTDQRARKNDTNDATQNAPTHHTNKKYKKIVKHRVNTSEDFDNIDSSCTNDESEDGKSDTSHNDQDSDVSLEIDNDEEIDAAEIKEEEWVEYIERSTIEVVEKMENEKIRCWKMTQRKMKWRLAMRIATSPSERWLIKAAEWNPELSSKYRTNSYIGRPRKRWEDDINEFLKQTEDETENLTESSNQSTKLGSTQQKTAEDGLYSRKITQWLQKKDMKIIRECEEILITYQRGTSMEWDWATKK